MNKKEIKSLADIIANAEELENIRDVRLKYKVVEDFEKIFPEFAEFIKAVKVNKKILSLRVEHSVLKQELILRQKDMIDKINKFYNKEVVNSIKFV